MTAEAKLSVRGVSKRYTGAKETQALESVSFDVHPGEFVMLLGPSGCGKSTLLGIIAGLTPASEGEVLVDGARVTSPGPDRGIVFQDGGLFPWLNVIRNVEFGLKQAGVAPSDRRERAMSYLQKVGLEAFAQSAIHELSGGMRQRVAIARCLVLEPEVVLMDEPFSALDEITREELYEELQGLWEGRSTTVVFVTHNVREAVTLGDRVLLMAPRPGRLQEVFDIGILRPRRTDDGDVMLRAREITMTMQAVRR